MTRLYPNRQKAQPFREKGYDSGIQMTSSVPQIIFKCGFSSLSSQSASELQFSICGGSLPCFVRKSQSRLCLCCMSLAVCSRVFTHASHLFWSWINLQTRIVQFKFSRVCVTGTRFRMNDRYLKNQSRRPKNANRKLFWTVIPVMNSCAPNSTQFFFHS